MQRTSHFTRSAELAHERGDVRLVRVELLDEPAAGERDPATTGLLAGRPGGPRLDAAGHGGKKQQADQPAGRDWTDGRKHSPECHARSPWREGANGPGGPRGT